MSYCSSSCITVLDDWCVNWSTLGFLKRLKISGRRKETAKEIEKGKEG
jgi:hypothetical protein